jgi:hypothetical protein
MYQKDIAIILSSWLRISQNKIKKTITKLIKNKIIENKEIFNGLDVACILLAILTDSLSYTSNLDFNHLTHLELEGEIDKNPLNVLPKKPFSELVKTTGSIITNNKFLSLTETLEKSFFQQIDNIRIVEVEYLKLNIYGEIIEGIIGIQYNDEIYEYPYTIFGKKIERKGLMQSSLIDKATINGIGWVLNSEKALKKI